jgi:hypothetical protein
VVNVSEIQRIEREAEQLRQRQIEARAKHQEVLRNNLCAMARHWNEPREVRAFLLAIEQAVPAHDRTEILAAWLEWAAQQVAALDPLMNPDRIAKRMEPALTTTGR